MQKTVIGRDHESLQRLLQGQRSQTAHGFFDGVELALHVGAHIGEAREMAFGMGEKEGLAYINGFDHPHIIAGAGSMGVCRVDSEEELRRIYTKVVADMGRAVVTSGALVYAPESGETGASSKAFDVVMMMEQYLDGPEVDVDIVLSDGRAVYAEVTDNWPTIEPYFQEVGANCPSVLTRTQQDELIQLSVAATLSLGFTCGVFHVESKYTSQGARLIEVNCRMGGMQVRNINLLTWGVDLVEEHLLTVVGLPSRPQRAPAPKSAISEMAFNAPRSGRMKDLSFIDEWTVRRL
jgi:carnosine synthase